MITRLKNMRWRALSRLFAALAAFISLLVFWYQPAFLERLDEIGRDIVFKMRDTPQASPQVVVVAVDEKSVSETGRWPWDRSTQATLLEKLKSYGPKVIGLDIIYLHSQGQEQDQYLVKSLSSPGSSVVGGYFFRDQQSFRPDDNSVNLLFDNMISQVNYQASSDYPAIQFPFVEVNQPEIAAQMQGFGFFNYLPEADGLIRRAPLILGFEDVMFPSLALKTLSVYFDEEISVDVAQDGFESVRLGNRTIPVDNIGRLSLNFYAEDRRIKIISASDVLWGELDKNSLKDKLIFVGVTELGVADVRPTPVSPNFPGVAVHATVAANVIQDYYIKQNINTLIINVLLIIAIPFLLILVIARIRRPLFQFTAFLLTLGFTAFIFAYLLSAYSLLISLIYPLMAAIIGYIGFQTYYVLVSQKHSKFLRTAFSTYVSPNVVEKLINSPEKLRLEGEKREITVLFSDVRDFTKFSEKLEPEQLVHVMNTYFDPMTDLVMDRQGTLDKYIGDALMAIYNAPLDVEEHALLAAETAVLMIEALTQLNQQFIQEYNIHLDIGIGINTGPAVVGNMGSSQRFDYTAMGDSVNLASRLEARSKNYGVKIIVSESTYELIKEKFVCRLLDRIRVKGKTQPVSVYELIGKTESPYDRGLLTAYQAAIETYFKGDFSVAVEQFESLAQSYPNDKPTLLMLGRARDYLHKRPGDWDGVFTATDK